MGLILDKIIIDGIQFDYLPDIMEKVTTAPYGVRTQTMQTMSGDTFALVLSPEPLTSRPGYQYRKAYRQAWKLGWSQTFMDVDQKNYLETLHTLQKGFWIQMDDEMSFDMVNLIPFENGQEISYFTPTYPIAPYGYTPTSPNGYAGTVFVNGNPVDGGAIVVDSEVGMVRFNYPLVLTDQVQMQYTWKAMVRIIECDIVLDQESYAQGVYTGQIVIEQITPNYYRDPWLINIPDNTITPGALSTVYTQASWESVASGVSGMSGWSELSVPTGETLVNGVWTNL